MRFFAFFCEIEAHGVIPTAVACAKNCTSRRRPSRSTASSSNSAGVTGRTTPRPSTVEQVRTLFYQRLECAHTPPRRRSRRRVLAPSPQHGPPRRRIHESNVPISLCQEYGQRDSGTDRRRRGRDTRRRARAALRRAHGGRARVDERLRRERGGVSVSQVTRSHVQQATRTTERQRQQLEEGLEPFLDRSQRLPRSPQDGRLDQRR